ncbi:MAG TPA: POTRA domain-containing protein [Kofleriaceae bacterium]|nr:POTRA domain-containing protein [Kofleriaceae bacterium]
MPLDGTVASVAIEGAPELAPLLRGVVETHTGQDVSQAPLREDLRRLWALGVLADARVDAHEEADGLAVVFAVTPQPRIARVLGAEAPELRRLRWLSGTPYEPARVQRVAREIEAGYVRDGYLDASVAVRRSRGFDLCVRVVRGPHVTIRSLVFRGAHRVTQATLLGALHGKGVNHPGGTYDAVALDEDSIWLLDEYYERGMIEAKIGTPEVARHGDHVDVIVPVTEGQVFHIGVLSGLAVPPRIRAGDLFVRSELATAMQELGDKLDAVVTPVTNVDESHRTIAIEFQIQWRSPWSALRYFSR